MIINKKEIEEFYNNLTNNLKSEFGENTRIWVWPDGDDESDENIKNNPEVRGVKGFYGNGVINNKVVIWITERPSSARDELKAHKFPDNIDKIFYTMLREEGLQNIHFTDFVKIMDKASKKPTEKELELSAKLMKKEIEMLKIQNKELLIIANSRDVEKWMNKYLQEYFYIYKPFFKIVLGRFKKKYGGQKALKETLKEIYEMTKKS